MHIVVGMICRPVQTRLSKATMQMIDNKVHLWGVARPCKTSVCTFDGILRTQPSPKDDAIPLVSRQCPQSGS